MKKSCALAKGSSKHLQ